MTRSAAKRPDTILLDTSAAVALCAVDHPGHDAVVKAVGETRIGLAGHAWFETFSVLTRLPPPHRRSPADVLVILRENFPATVFLSVETQRAFTKELASLPIAGGSIYDGLVALSARSANLPLLSRDRRAASTYAAMGVESIFVD